MSQDRHVARKIRSARIRFTIRQVAGDRPRLSVFRSAKHIYAQIIDDAAGRTIASASTVEKEIREQLKSGGNKEAAALVGQRIAEKAKAANVRTVVFDRSGYLYHGRVKTLADAAREGGLDF
ncbi:MAG: 50S ribosomal protein L18 [Magnetococcales bacterium]|nr:50S ribosomal protein L18 [Magnetococcales bacterium]MBF0261687.1 50S ribosomal protein L18 [Magnetococcales bacterium]